MPSNYTSSVDKLLPVNLSSKAVVKPGGGPPPRLINNIKKLKQRINTIKSKQFVKVAVPSSMTGRASSAQNILNGSSATNTAALNSDIVPLLFQQ